MNKVWAVDKNSQLQEYCFAGHDFNALKTIYNTNSDFFFKFVKNRLNILT